MSDGQRVNETRTGTAGRTEPRVRNVDQSRYRKNFQKEK